MNEQEMTEQEFYQWLGKRIRELREKAGIKKKDLAEKLGVTATFLSNIENKGQKISAYQITRLLKVMGLSQGDLFDEEGKKTLSYPQWRPANEAHQRREAGIPGKNQARL